MRSYFSTLVYVLLGGALLSVAACGGVSDPGEERIRHAKAGEGDIVIGAPWPWEARGETSLYGKGMDLAVEEINARGGVLGRPLRVKRVDDRESINEGRMAAQTLIDDPEVIGVIGHLQSYITIAASSIYDLGGVVMIAPVSTSPELTQQGYRHVFRTTFNDKQVGRQMAVLAHQRGYERIAILYKRDTYGRHLANAFEERAQELGLNVIERRSYTPAAEREKTSFGTVLDAWNDIDFDAVFLAGALPEAGIFIVQARAAGIAVPILGGDAMDNENLMDVGGEAAEGTVVASNFHLDDPRPAVQQFVKAFKAKTGQLPNRGAAASYDAVWILADAIEEAGTTVPEQVIQALRGMAPKERVTGSMSFDDNGDLVNNMLIAKVVQNGQFEYLDVLTGPLEMTSAGEDMAARVP